MFSKLNISLKIVIFFSLILVSTLFFLFYYYFLPMQEKQLKRNLYDKVKTVSDLSQPLINKALKNNDDITLLSQIEEILKIKDINSAYILDNKGRVITHNQTSEWGKIYDDEISRKIVEKKKEMVNKIPSGYLYSIPITSSATFCIRLSEQKIKENMNALEKNVGYTFLSISVTGILLFYLFIFSQFKTPLKNLGHVLKAVAVGGIGKIEIKKHDEIGVLIKLVNDIIEKFEQDSSTSGVNVNEVKNNTKIIIEEIAKNISSGIMIIDSENRLIHINQKACDFLSVSRDNTSGKHILDFIQDALLIDLINKTVKEIGKNFEEKINDRIVKAVTVGNKKGENLITIITI
ncbi:MAG: PAS domain-containing protein [Endomicrobiales bacterium]|nr:PAS domain-containing protein [Endomicrobiales bacterium]